MMNNRISIVTVSLILIAGVLGFGESVWAQVIFEDGFESGNLSEINENTGARWTNSGTGLGDYVVVSSERYHSDNHSLKFFFEGNLNLSDDAWAQQGFNLGQTQTELFMRFYIYFPLNYEVRTTGGSNNAKFFNIWGANYSDPMTIDMEIEATMDSYFKAPKAGYPSFLDCNGYVGVVPDLPPWTLRMNNLGRWNCFEVHLKRDGGAGDGVIQLWIDGELVIDGTNLSWVGAPCSPGYFLNGYLMGWSNSGFDEDTSIFIDDIVFSKSYIGTVSEDGEPTRSNHQPTGTLPSGTSSNNISLITNVHAVCRYSNKSNTNYTYMEYNFTNTNSTNHSTLVTGLENGQTYIFYVRCNSSYGYVNDNDFNISFSIDGHKADLNDDGVINMPELMVFIGRWKAGDGVSKVEVLDARDIWFSGGDYQ